jgi:hypothetical protein
VNRYGAKAELLVFDSSFAALDLLWIANILFSRIMELSSDTLVH